MERPLLAQSGCRSQNERLWNSRRWRQVGVTLVLAMRLMARLVS
jgi:hypothetical protein